MTPHKKVNKEDALASLNMIKDINNRIKTSYQFPTWLNVSLIITSTLYTFAHSMAEISGFWASTKLPLLLALLITISLIVYKQSKTGIKVHTPLKRYLFTAVSIAFFVSIFTFAPIITKEGHPIAAYISAVLMGIGVSYSIYLAPSLDFINLGEK
jgi:hypothetical protein